MIYTVSLLSMILCLSCISVQAEVVTGTVDSGSFSYLGKFCFSADASLEEPPQFDSQGNRLTGVVGNIDITLTTPSENQKNNNNLYLTLYDDEPNSWSRIYHDNVDCSVKINNTFVKWTQLVRWDGNGTYTIKGSDVPIRQAARPRFWFLALAQCGSTPFKSVSFNLHFKNIEFNAWDTEFGSNEQGLNTIYMTYFFIYVVFVAVHLYGVRSLYSKLHYLHPLIKLFTAVILTELVAILLGLLHYGVYSSDGVGVPALLKLSAVLVIVSRLLFIGLLLLLARGWTISNHEVTGKWPIIISISIFTIVHIIILLWTYVVEDPAETDVPFTVFVLLNMLIVCYVIFAVIFIYFATKSYMREDNLSKKNLYLKLLFIFGLWFLLPPLSEWGATALEDWKRTRVVEAIEITVTTVGYMVLAFLLWPSRADDYFAVTTPNVESSDIGYDPLLM